jgi:hypothetical protein
MFNTIVGAEAKAGAGAASCYGSGFYQMMRLLAAPAPQHCLQHGYFARLNPPLRLCTETICNQYHFNMKIRALN